MSIYSKIQGIIKTKTFNRVAPLVTLIAGMWIITKEIASTRYEFSNQSVLTPEEAAAYGIVMKKPSEVTLETEYEKIKDLDIDNWHNVRIPRPWEEEEQNKQ